MRKVEIRSAAILTAALALALPSGNGLGAQERTFTDLEIAQAIDLSLMSQGITIVHDLDVGVVDGVVTLAGRVDSLYDAERALRVARTTRGVRSIVDQIRVEPAARTDAELERDAARALARDPALEPAEIEVAVQGGRAVLRGAVHSWQEKHFAQQVVLRVPGLRGVDNQLSIDYSQPRTDAEIAEDVTRRLRSDVLVDSGLIETTVENGQVTLQGIVGSVEERERAYTDAWVTGAKLVDASDLEVRWWARDRMRLWDPRFRSDAEVARSVRDALGYDPRVPQDAVVVTARAGSVTLAGVVPSAGARVAAEQDARNTRGALRVRNLLKVRPAQPPTDADLAASVTSALTADPYLIFHTFGVEAENGRVLLSGWVDSAFDERRALAVARGVHGVRAVRSRIERGDSAAAALRADRELEAEIADALFWDALVDESNIQVVVEGGVAILTGWVDDPREYARASRAARSVGVLELRNRLEIRTDPPEGSS